MVKRIRPYTVILEAGFIGLFFVQSLRFLIGALYSRLASAALVTSYPSDSYDSSISGIIDPSVVSIEIMLVGLVIALPILTLLIGRLRFAPLIGAIMVIVGRALITFEGGITSTIAAEIAVGGALFYIAVIVGQRARSLPYLFVFGLAFEQVIRAFGNTLDPTIFSEAKLVLINLSFTAFYLDFAQLLAVLLGITILITVFNSLTKSDSSEERLRDGTMVNPDKGLLAIWGALGMGGLLFLELSLLALPNAIAGRADTDYTGFVPFVIVVTLLPIIPEIRAQARNLIAPFDPSARGWIWLIFIALMIVVGTRIQHLPVVGSLLPIGGLALLLAQFAVSMVWWWLARPKTDTERNLGSIWLVLTILIFVLLVIGDMFSYEYAFVRPFFIPNNIGLTDFLNRAILPLLRGFRGLGLGLILLAVLLSTLPMIQSTRRIPWHGGKLVASLLTGALVAIFAILGAFAARPPQVIPVVNAETIRVGTFNIHSGYTEFYGQNLGLVVRDISNSGATVLLLQEVEAGRLTSFGVDQSLWLARRLGMDRRFYPTNEGLFGLAVLSKVPIVFDDGVLLPSIDQQTGLQRVQIQPEPNVNSVITIYNTELGLLLQQPDLADLEGNQRTQLQRILGTIEQHRINDYGGQLGRTILGGTFHNVPVSPVMDSVRNYGFNDPFAGTNLALTATLNRSNLEPARFDYLWVWAQSLPEIGTGVIPSKASDHRLAYVEFEIQLGN
jgi:endonuclease/exonuclease/phosphatase (EEP) superfamily protein YafD